MSEVSHWKPQPAELVALYNFKCPYCKELVPPHRVWYCETCGGVFRITIKKLGHFPWSRKLLWIDCDNYHGCSLSNCGSKGCEEISERRGEMMRRYVPAN